MRRYLLAIGVLVTVAVSTSSAGYLIIRVMLDGSGGPATVGSSPLLGPGGPLGSAGGKPGSAGGGPGPGSFGSGGPPIGLGSSSGGGGKPGGLAGGLPGMGGMGMGMAAGPVGPVDPTRSIVVVIPFTKRPFERDFNPNRTHHEQLNPKWDYVLLTQFGYTNLFTDGQTIQWYMDAVKSPALLKTRQSTVLERYESWKKTRGIEPLYDLMVEALEHGMAAEATKYADELLELTKTAKNPLTNRVKNFTTAYGAIQKKLAGTAPKANSAQQWREIIDSVDARVATQKHYSLIYWDATPEELNRRFTLLEDNFKAFYLWHCTQGIALNVPEQPLLAVLPRRVSPDMFNLSKGLDGLPMEVDAFYSQEHDILVLAPERVDDAGQTFLRQNASLIYKDGLSRSKLLSGKDAPKIDQHNDKNHIARMMTLALVEKYSEMEAEIAGVSREGSRQLLYASGALPRHVVLPRWVSNGSANFFTRPKGPVYTKKDVDPTASLNTPGAASEGSTVGAPQSTSEPQPKYTMTVALTTGYGVPNFVMHKYFKDMTATKELNADRGQLLRNVVTDAYFNALTKDGEDIDPLPKAAVAIPIPKGGFSPSPFGGFGGPGMGGPPMLGSSAGGGGKPGLGSSAGPGPGASNPPRPGMGSMQPPPGMGGMQVSAPEVEDEFTIRRKKVERLSHKTQATSWALYYFLSKQHKDELKQYLDEMARMPRDLPVDEQTALKVFAKAFNLTTSAKGEAGKKTFAEFGQEWMNYMATLAPVGIDIQVMDPPPSTGGPAMGGPGAGGKPNFGGGGSSDGGNN